MDDQAVSSQVFSRTRNVFFRARPIIYILIVLGGCASSYLYKVRAHNIFSCQASGYTADHILHTATQQITVTTTMEPFGLTLNLQREDPLQLRMCCSLGTAGCSLHFPQLPQRAG